MKNQSLTDPVQCQRLMVTGFLIITALIHSVWTPASVGQSPAADSKQIDSNRAFVRFADIPPKAVPPDPTVALPPLPERSAEPIAASRKLIAEQRFTEAALELERALRFARDHWEIHAQLAMLHWQAGNIERARTSAAKTVEENPQSVIGHYILGRCLAASGKRTEAIHELRLAVLCRTFNADLEVAALVHFHLAEMLAAEGYLTAAIEQYEAFGQAAAKASPTPRGELASLLATRRGSMEQSKAQMLELLGRFDEAAAILRPSVEKSPEDVALRVRLVRLLLAANRTDEAAAVLAQTVSDDDEILNLLEELRRKSGHPEAFIEDLKSRAKDFPNSARIVNRLARALLESGQPDAAFAQIEQFLANNPSDPPIRQTQLDILVRTKRWNDALRLTAEKLKADPAGENEVQAILEAVRGTPGAVAEILATSSERSTDPWHLYLLGALAVDAHRYEEAEALLRRSLAGNVRLIPARAALGELLVRKCDYDAARRVVAREKEDEPQDARLERVLGRLYERQDELERAEVHYRAALQIDRADVRSMYALADIYRRLKKGLQAQHQLRALLELRPSHEPARELLALLFLDDRRPDAARAEYKQLEKLSPKATTQVRCRILLDEKLIKDPLERRRLLLEAIDQSAPDAPALAAVAETYDESDAAKAREYFSHALDLDPEDEESRLGILRSYQHELRFDKVAEGLADLLQCRPNQHNWRRMLAGMYSLTEQFDRALAIVEPFDTNPDIVAEVRNEYRETIVETLREAGRGDEAIARLRGWAAGETNGGPWSVRLAQEQMRQRRYQDAIKTYASLIELSPENRGIRDRLLEALLESRQFVQAEQWIVKWFAEDPENDRLVLVLAQAISRSGRVDEAVDLIETWLTRTSRRELFQNMLVSIYAVAGRYDACARLLEELTDEVMGLIHTGGERGRVAQDHAAFEDRRTRMPNEPFSVDRLHERYEMLRFARVTALGNARRFDEAQRLLNELRDSNPDPGLRLDVMARQAALYRLQGKEDEAVAILQAALPERASTESLSNDIAYSWIDRGIRLEEAEKLIRHSVGRIPRQAAYLDTYGWLLYKKGDLEGARLWLARANRVRGGDDPVIHDHLGDTLWRLGRKDEAIEQWSLAVELIKDRTEHELSNDDERRVARVTNAKVEDAKAGRDPQVADLGVDIKPQPIEPEPQP